MTSAARWLLPVVVLLAGCSHAAPKADVSGLVAAWHRQWPGIPHSADPPMIQKEREVCAEPDAQLVSEWKAAQEQDPAGMNKLIQFQIRTALHYLCPSREQLLNLGVTA